CSVHSTIVSVGPYEFTSAILLVISFCHLLTPSTGTSSLPTMISLAWEVFSWGQESEKATHNAVGNSATEIPRRAINSNGSIASDLKSGNILSCAPKLSARNICVTETSKVNAAINRIVSAGVIRYRKLRLSKCTTSSPRCTTTPLGSPVEPEV